MFLNDITSHKLQQKLCWKGMVKKQCFKYFPPLESLKTLLWVKNIFMRMKQQSEILLQFVWGLAIIWNTLIIL